MALVNLLQRLREEVRRGLLPVAALVAPDLDCTERAQAIIARGDALYLPRRPAAAPEHGDIPYRIAGLVPRRPSQDRSPAGAIIICESARVTVTADDPSAWIMDVDGGGIEGLTISGGTWGRRSRGVFRYAKSERARGSVNRAVFERMTITGCIRGFEVGSANGTVWRECAFSDVDDVGVFLGKTAAPDFDRGNIHACALEHCAFRDIGSAPGRGTAIALDADCVGRGRSKAGITILGGSFERTGQYAIHAKGPLRELSIEGCVFADSRGRTHDICIESNGTGVRTVVIRENVFGGGAERARVRCVGRVSMQLTDNVIAGDTGGRPATLIEQDGPTVSPGASSRVWLERNFPYADS